MKSVTIVAALALGCAHVQRHPFAAAAIGNTALVIGAGACAMECGGTAQGISEGVLVGELALSSMLSTLMLVWLVGEAEGRP